MVCLNRMDKPKAKPIENNGALNARAAWGAPACTHRPVNHNATKAKKLAIQL